MSISLFVNFSGNCKEAVDFYATVFDCEKPKFMTYAEAPTSDDFPPLPPEQQKLIMYTDLKIADNIIMFSDVPPFMPLIAGNNISITVGSKSKEDIEKWFERLSVGAEIHMPPQKTFWSDYYCMLTDKFGIPWQFSHDSGITF